MNSLLWLITIGKRGGGGLSVAEEGWRKEGQICLSFIFVAALLSNVYFYSTIYDQTGKDFRFANFALCFLLIFSLDLEWFGSFLYTSNFVNYIYD